MAAGLLSVQEGWTEEELDVLNRSDIHYIAKGYLLTCLDSHMNWSDVPLCSSSSFSSSGKAFHKVQECLWEFLTFFQKLVCDVTLWCWTGRPGFQSALSFIPLVFCQDSVQASQVHPHQTLSSCLDGAALCAGAVMLEQEGPSPNCSHRAASWNCPASLGVLKLSEFISLELRDQVQLLKNNHTPWSPSTKLYTWHSAVRQVLFSSKHQTQTAPSGQMERTSPLLQSPVAASFTSLHPALTCSVSLRGRPLRSQSLPLWYNTADSWLQNI